MLLLGPMILGEEGGRREGGGREGVVKEDRVHAQHMGRFGAADKTHTARCPPSKHFGLPYTPHSCKDVTDRKWVKVNSVLPHL